MTRVEALAAIRAELDPRLADEYAVNAPDLVDAVVGLVAEGACNAATAAEALTVAAELADATVAGDLAPNDGVELMAKIGLRHRGELGSD